MYLQQEIKVWGPTGYPLKDMQYAACLGDFDLDAKVGYGKTPEEAIEDLNWKMEDV